jgi:hypothetical protein
LDLGALVEGDDIDDGDNLDCEICLLAVLTKVVGMASIRSGKTHSPSKEARGAYSADGPAHDKHHRVGGRAADDRADLKEHSAGEEDGPDGEDGVDLAEEWLEGAAGEEVCAAVPADVVERVEFVGDGGDGLVEAS